MLGLKVIRLAGAAAHGALTLSASVIAEWRLPIAPSSDQKDINMPMPIEPSRICVKTWGDVGTDFVECIVRVCVNILETINALPAETRLYSRLCKFSSGSRIHFGPGLPPNCTVERTDCIQKSGCL